MNGPRQFKTQPRRGTLPGFAACRHGVGGLQIVDRASNQAAAGYCDAVDGEQFEQRALVSILALSVRGKRLDKQGHHQALSDRAGRAGADFLHPQRSNAQRGCMVCRDMGPTAPSCGHGCRPAIFATWRVQPMGSEKCRALPKIRTYRQGYRPEIRTWGVARRPEIRTYMPLFRWLPMPDFRTPSRNAICTEGAQQVLWSVNFSEAVIVASTTDGDDDGKK